ncbi:hypothetical protein [Flavobacterium fluviatile]|uniref:hypothetical protein n=1 Tax=Flavobacterium fluviatile TaxID=1862387 RepID=UPI0013D609E0|nr:hypothetical protein [Flavobacterium fluviatile]
MRKIQKVIDTCYDCEFCQQFKKTKNESTKAFICLFEADESTIKHQPFLLDVCENGSNHIDIPDNCPLETYKPIEV